MSKYVVRVKGRHLWNPSNFGISVFCFRAVDCGQFKYSWGNNIMAHAGDMGPRPAYLPRESLPHHSTICDFYYRVCIYAQLDHRPPGKLKLTDHGPNVSAVLSFHDYRSETYCAFEKGAMHLYYRGLRRNAVAFVPKRVCPFTAALPGRPTALLIEMWLESATQ